MRWSSTQIFALKQRILLPKGSRRAINVRALHGHSYHRCGLPLRAKSSPDTGWIMDFRCHRIKSFDPLLEQLDHHYLNDVRRDWRTLPVKISGDLGVGPAQACSCQSSLRSKCSETCDSGLPIPRRLKRIFFLLGG